MSDTQPLPSPIPDEPSPVFEKTSIQESFSKIDDSLSTLGGKQPTPVDLSYLPSSEDSLARDESTDTLHQPEVFRRLPTPVRLVLGIQEDGILGHFRLLQELGRGGMGVVFEAEDMRLKRRVALKVILPEYVLQETFRTRFESEAQTVARIHHPHVVQVYEIGEDNGHLYCSMELLESDTLAKRIDGEPQDPIWSAKIISSIASGLAEVHRCGIIHRDLKPSNVLLSSDTIPKISDFGLAKQVNCESGMTQTGQLMGTPSYMAPEQAADNTKNLTMGVDVYSMGAILYEMLTGRPPFRAPTVIETLALVRSEEPISPRQFNPRCPKDLETICLKCLRKDFSRRYSDAQELRDDLERFLGNRPILARPVSTPEHLWRWCRRNRSLAILTLSLFLVLVGGVVGMTILWQKAKEAQAEAEENAQRYFDEQLNAKKNEAEAIRLSKESEERRQQAVLSANKAEKVSEFLVRMFEASDPLGINSQINFVSRNGGEELRVRDLLVDTRNRLANDPDLPPETRAHLKDQLGKVYLVLGNFPESERLITEGLQERRKLVPEDHPDVIASLNHLAWIKHARGDYGTAKELYGKVIAIRERLSSTPENELLLAGTEFHLAWLFLEDDDLIHAQDLINRVLEKRIRLLGENHRDVAHARFVLAGTLFARMDSLNGIAETRKAVDIFRASLANRPSSPNGQENNIIRCIELAHEGHMFNGLKQFDTAEARFLQADQLLREILGEHHIYRALFLGEIINIRRLQGRYAEAEKDCELCLKIIEGSVGITHPRVAHLMVLYGVILNRQRKYQQAEELFRRWLDAHQKLGPKNVGAPDALVAYGMVLRNRGEVDIAIEPLKKALQMYQVQESRWRTYYLECLYELALAYKEKQQFALAEPLAERLVEGLTAVYDHKKSLIAQGESLLGQLRIAVNKFDARTLELLLSAKSALGPTLIQAPDPDWFGVQEGLIRYYSQTNALPNAIKVIQEMTKHAKSMDLWLRVARGCCYGLNQLLGDSRELTSDEEMLRKDLVGKGIDAFRQANKAGKPNWSQITKNPLAKQLFAQPEWKAVEKEFQLLDKKEPPGK